MNLQQRRAGAHGLLLPAALGLSVLLHLLLIWPAPSPHAESDRPAVRSAPLRLLPAATASLSGPPPARLQAAVLAPVAPAAVIASAAAPGGKTALAEARSVTESSMRALRFSIARGFSETAPVAGVPGARVVLELRMLARRVVAVRVLRPSGHDEFDARVVEALKYAAREAVIPDDVPSGSFAVELELEAGSTLHRDDEGPGAPG
jgi:hypothetical protein